MNKPIVRCFSKDTADFRSIDCGIFESILSQLKERNKGCAIFNESEYVFGSFSTSVDHRWAYDTLAKSIKDKYHFIVAVYPVDFTSDCAIEINILPDGNWICSEFEKKIISQVYKEARAARLVISRPVISNEDDFYPAQLRRENTLLGEQKKSVNHQPRRKKAPLSFKIRSIFHNMFNHS